MSIGAKIGTPLYPLLCGLCSYALCLTIRLLSVSLINPTVQTQPHCVTAARLLQQCLHNVKIKLCLAIPSGRPSSFFWEGDFRCSLDKLKPHNRAETHRDTERFYGLVRTLPGSHFRIGNS